MQAMAKISKSLISGFSKKIAINHLLTFRLSADLLFNVSYFFGFLFTHAKTSNRKTMFKLFGKWQYAVGMFVDKGLQKYISP